MEISRTLSALQKTVSHNSPSILTAIGVSGVATTAILASKASFQAADLISREERYRDDWVDGQTQLTNKERFNLVWKLYIPAVGTGVTAAVCIISANSISSRRNAALISAYTISENAFKEYKEKVVEQIGKNKEEKVRDSIAQDRINADPIGDRQLIITGRGNVRCYESITGRYFESSVEVINKAVNKMNLQIINDMYISQNDFFDELGLGRTSFGDEVGWNHATPLEVQYSSIMSEDDIPCIVLGYRRLPTPNYTDLH
jgi:hypothetical protein